VADHVPQRRYTGVARLFHWSIAGLILFQVPLAYYMIDLPLSPAKLENYALHKSIGLTILALTAARLGWRWLKPPPPLPASLSVTQRRLAKLTHAVLYVITFAMPLTGWLGSSAANFPVSVFGWFTMPDLVAPNAELHERLELAHRLLAYTLFTTFTLHAGAALYHQFVLRDGVLAAMLPGSGHRKPT
jgi:cytochrome b561